jgi:DNA polymerase III subunit delta'
MSFSSIIGQERPVERIRNYIRHKRLAGAYLFTGPEGVGKFLAAIEFAKALNCLSLEDDACDRCSSCLKINKLQHPDLHVIDAEGDDIKIEYIRQLQKEISLRPYEARSKVFIFRDAHNLNPSSSNALLKILEEPSAHSRIILVTDKPNKLLKTVISRCQVIKFSALARQGLERVLRQGYAVEEKEAHFLAYLSEGRLGRALGLKDGEFLAEKNAAIDEFILGKSSRSPGKGVLDRDDTRRILNILATWFRDLYLAKAGMPESEMINLDRKEELFKLTQRFTFVQLDEILGFISRSFLYVDQNVNTKLLISNLKLLLKG